MILLEVCNLFSRGMYEYKIRNNRNQSFGFHAVIDSYGITFRYEIFQAIFAAEFFFRLFSIFIGTHDEPADSCEIIF